MKISHVAEVVSIHTVEFFFQEYYDNGGSGCWEEKVFIVMGLILIVYFLANWQAELSSPIFLSGAVNSQDG